MILNGKTWKICSLIFHLLQFTAPYSTYCVIKGKTLKRIPIIKPTDKLDQVLQYGHFYCMEQNHLSMISSLYQLFRRHDLCEESAGGKYWGINLLIWFVQSRISNFPDGIVKKLAGKAGECWETHPHPAPSPWKGGIIMQSLHVLDTGKSASGMQPFYEGVLLHRQINL